MGQRLKFPLAHYQTQEISLTHAERLLLKKVVDIVGERFNEVHFRISPKDGRLIAVEDNEYNEGPLSHILDRVTFRESYDFPHNLKGLDNKLNEALRGRGGREAAK